MTLKLTNIYEKEDLCGIRPVVTFTCDTWTLSVWDINNLLVFEGQILKEIFGLLQSKEGWRIRSNNELRKLIKGEDTVKYIKARRIKWWGCLNRMADTKLFKKITDWNPIGVRTKGWSKNRWIDEVINDLEKLKLRIGAKFSKIESLESSGADDQNPCRVIVSDKEGEEMNKHNLCDEISATLVCLPFSGLH